MAYIQRFSRLAVLRVLLVVGVVESFIHYLDNTVRFDDYHSANPPAISSWIPQWLIPMSWVLFTAAAVIGYRRFVQGDRSTAAFWIGVYSISGLISTLHYVDITPANLSPFQNTFVFADIALGVALLGFAVATAMTNRTATAPSARSTSLRA